MERRTIVLTAMGVILSGVLAGEAARAADGAATTTTGRGVYDRSDLRKVDYSGLPAPTTITVRDGTPLTVRVYPSPGTTVILAIHGSSGNGRYYHPLAQYLSTRGKASVYVPDLRGHGASGGRRGDVDYVGQLEDDVADVLAIIRRERPGARIVLLGHSSGGGLLVRFAGGSRVSAVDGYVLLAPFLGADAPTSRPDSGGWATADIPKIIEVTTDTAMGNASGQGAIVLRFNMPPSEAAPDQVLAYSYRMMMSYNPRRDLALDLAAIRRPLLVLAGERDESFYAERYEPTIAPHAKATVRVLPGVTHLGLVVNPVTAEAIEAWLGTLP